MDSNQQLIYGNNPQYYYQQPAEPYQSYPLQQYYNQYTETPASAENSVVPKGILKSWFDFTDSSYLKGLLTGAGVAMVLGHPRVRKAIISGAVSTWDAVSCGFEELKEQVEDVRAEKKSDAE